MKKFNLEAWSLDVEIAFLNGELNGESFMKVPEGLQNEEFLEKDKFSTDLRVPI
jgi:hypothetical protein